MGSQHQLVLAAERDRYTRWCERGQSCRGPEHADRQCPKWALLMTTDTAGNNNSTYREKLPRDHFHHVLSSRPQTLRNIHEIFPSYFATHNWVHGMLEVDY